jgi:phage baseplate assembly protein gpV
MKIFEVTRPAKVVRNTGKEVEIDHGDGTTTTVDTEENPNAIERDPSGKLTVNTAPSNSAMAQKKKQQQTPRAGEQVSIS